MNIKTTISSLNHQGKGIAKYNDKVVFISNALPDEDVDIKITESKKRFDEAEVINYNSFSKTRVKPECPYYNECGGCNISHMNYESQVKFKENKFKDILSRYSDLEVKPNVITSGNEFNYRNKITLKVVNGTIGYFKTKSNTLIEIDKCLIASNAINKIIEYKHLLNIKNGEVIIRSNYKDEIIMVITSQEKVNINKDELLKVANIVGIIINDGLFYGLDFFYEKINNHTFKVDYKSFFQVNNNILEKIGNILNKNKYNNVVDLYCGVGVLGTSIESSKLFGIEVSDSIKDARYNSKMNELPYTKYIKGDSSKIEEIKDEIDLLIIDPPRKGIDNKTMNHILEKSPDNIIYMSCDPMSLSRDLNKLREIYIVNETYILDMFPQTYHVESLVFMSKI